MFSTERLSCYVYHPQTKLRKGNVFTSVCQEFCPQGGGKRVSVPACTTGHMTRGSLSSGGSLSRILSQGGREEGLCPSMHHRSHDQGVSVQGVSLSREGSLLERPPCTVGSRRYASYWNAFLLMFVLSCILLRNFFHTSLQGSSKQIATACTLGSLYTRFCLQRTKRCKRYCSL